MQTPQKPYQEVNGGQRRFGFVILYYTIRRAAPQGGKYGKQRLSRPFPGKKTERGGVKDGAGRKDLQKGGEPAIISKNAPAIRRAALGNRGAERESLEVVP